MDEEDEGRFVLSVATARPCPGCSRSPCGRTSGGTGDSGAVRTPQPWWPCVPDLVDERDDQ